MTEATSQTILNYRVTIWKDKKYQDEYILAERITIDDFGNFHFLVGIRTVAVYSESMFCSAREMQG